MIFSEPNPVLTNRERNAAILTAAAEAVQRGEAEITADMARRILFPQCNPTHGGGGNREVLPTKPTAAQVVFDDRTFFQLKVKPEYLSIGKDVSRYRCGWYWVQVYMYVSCVLGFSWPELSRSDLTLHVLATHHPLTTRSGLANPHLTRLPTRGDPRRAGLLPHLGEQGPASGCTGGVCAAPTGRRQGRRQRYPEVDT